MIANAKQGKLSAVGTALKKTIACGMCAALATSTAMLGGLPGMNVQKAEAATALQAGKSVNFSVKNHHSTEFTYKMPSSGYFTVSITPGTLPKDSWGYDTFSNYIDIDTFQGESTAFQRTKAYYNQGTWTSWKYCLKAGKTLRIKITAPNVAGSSNDFMTWPGKITIKKSKAKATKKFEKEGTTNKKNLSKKKGASKSYEGVVTKNNGDKWVFKAKKKGTYKITVSNCSDSNDHLYAKANKKQLTTTGSVNLPPAGSILSNKASTKIKLKKNGKITLKLATSWGERQTNQGDYAHYKVTVKKVK